jgi:hypothetical protein
VQKALASNEESRKLWQESLETAQNAYEAFLQKKGIPDPKANVTRRRFDYDTLVKEHDDAVSRLKVKTAQIQRLEGEVTTLRKKQQEASPNDPSDAVYQKNKRELELNLSEVETRLGDDTRQLNSLRKKVKDIEDLVRKRIRLPQELEELQLNIKVLEGRVKSGEARVQAIQADLKQNKPYSADIQRHLSSIQTLKDEQIGIQSEISLKESRMEGAREAVSLAEKVEAEALPKINEIQRAQKAMEELNNRSKELRELLADVRPEVLINTEAVPGLNPKSNRKKVMILGFLVPAVCLFGVMIAFEMSSKSWRGESVAARLNLPILARFSFKGPDTLPPSGSAPGGQAERANANECRGLSLRLRQYVPDSGGIILFSSLNERNGVEELLASLIGYFAIRDEKVLLLDARIANTEADTIQRYVGRAAARRPVEVAPAADSLTITPGWRRGLVQYLVFEGQNPWDLAMPTRTPAVDYLPAGGPYPITDALASEAMRDLLTTCRKKYSLILLLGPAVAKSIDTEILASYVNGLVLVLNEPLSACTPETRTFFQSLKEADVPLLGTVLCM